MSGLGVRTDCPGDLSRQFSLVKDSEQTRAEKKVEDAERSVSSIMTALSRHQIHMSDHSMLNRLPDQGKKILMRVADLDEQLLVCQSSHGIDYDVRFTSFVVLQEAREHLRQAQLELERVSSGDTSTCNETNEIDDLLNSMNNISMKSQ